MDIRVREAGEEDGAKWDRFCDMKDASYAAYFYWRDILPRLGYKPLFLLAEDGAGGIRGILPAAVSRMFLRHYAQSTIADGRMYAGPLTCDAAVLSALVSRFDERCAEEGVAWSLHIAGPPYGVSHEARENVMNDNGYLPDTSNLSEKRHTFLLDLDPGYEEIFKRFSSALRTPIRKGLKEGVKIERDRWECADDIFDLKKMTWRRLGNMLPSRYEHDIAMDNLRRRGALYTARINDEMAGALYCYRTLKGRFLKGSFSDYRFHKYNISAILYAGSIEDACAEGAEYYDFGSTPPPGTSHYAWKARFRGTPCPLTFYRKVYRPKEYLVRKFVKKVTRPLARPLSFAAGESLERAVAWYEE